MAERDDGTLDHANYAVVLNGEEQYSVWDVGRVIPAGWREAGFRGTYDDCIAHIDTVWTDMRPLSLRQAMRDGG